MDEETKQQVLIAVIALCLTVTFYQIVFNSGMVIGEFGWLKLIGGLLLGAVVGGATYGIMKMLNR